MALEFNVGEFARRLSRALTVRGRMPLDLDERLVPTVLTEDASQAPFRQRGQRWYAPFTLLAADHAGTTAGLYITPTQVTPSTPPSEVAVVDRISFGRVALAGTPIVEFGYCAPQVNPAPWLSDVLRNCESFPHGGITSWTVQGDPSFNAVGSIPLGRLVFNSTLTTLDIRELGIVLYNAPDLAPIFYVSFPTSIECSGFISGRLFSLPLS